MATRSKITPAPAEDWRLAINGETVGEPDDPEEIEESNALEKLKSVFSTSQMDGLKVRVSRLEPRTGKFEWCKDYTGAEFELGDFEQIRSEWGPGTYEFRVYKTGQRGVLAKPIQKIAAPYNPHAGAPVASPQASDLGAAIRALMEGQQRMLELIAKPAPAAPDGKMQMMEMFAMMGAMREAMGLTTAAPSPGMGSPLAQLREAMEIIRGVKETASEIADEKKPDDLMSMLPNVLEMVKAGMAGQQPPQQQMMPPVVMPASMSEQNPMPAPMPASPPPDQVSALIFEGVVQQIATMASDGTSPEVGGEFIADNLPEELLPLLALPNWWAIVLAKAPTLEPHAQWIAAAKLHADKLLNEAHDGS